MFQPYQNTPTPATSIPPPILAPTPTTNCLLRGPPRLARRPLRFPFPPNPKKRPLEPHRKPLPKDHLPFPQFPFLHPCHQCNPWSLSHHLSTHQPFSDPSDSSCSNHATPTNSPQQSRFPTGSSAPPRPPRFNLPSDAARVTPQETSPSGHILSGSEPINPWPLLNSVIRAHSRTRRNIQPTPHSSKLKAHRSELTAHSPSPAGWPKKPLISIQKSVQYTIDTYVHTSHPQNPRAALQPTPKTPVPRIPMSVDERRSLFLTLEVLTKNSPTPRNCQNAYLDANSR